MHYGPDNPFLCADKIFREAEGKYDIALAEIHANATSEKLAMGYYLDGRASAVWGTHTHVQTADNRITPRGRVISRMSAWTGPVVSVLGRVRRAVDRHVPRRFDRIFQNRPRRLCAFGSGL